MQLKRKLVNWNVDEKKIPGMQYIKKSWKKSESLRDMEDSMRRSSIDLMRVPEGVNGENVAEKILKEIMAQNFPRQN